MKNNAISVANAFIAIAKEHNDSTLTPLKLMKLVYIAHGLCLALLDRSMIDPRFDRVEAWRLGPVIPSVYHTFKHYGNNPVTEQGIILRDEYGDNEAKVVTPQLKGDEEKRVVKLTWKLFGHYSGSQLVEMLHRSGTPWSEAYIEGENAIISDDSTKEFYNIFVDLALNGNE